IARQITIRPGSVVSIDDRMERGESTRPEDIATTTHERRDERIEFEAKRREELSRRDRDRMEDWRDRARRRMEERDRYDDDDEEREDEAEDRAEERTEERADDGIGRLRLDILPDDASVYLDGRFVGTGIDLQRLRNGLRLEPGQHRIAVVRPGHRAEEQEFTVAPGQEVDLDIELESMK
ncbi:MAG TPA: PEGA domain-containing protein, partial [Thermoanaerobaculia bacterium]|nr:PEGA domain-containing protein [Thermoanaerobaculia bacterium]